MTLLVNVCTAASGLEGVTESGDIVKLSIPTPRVLTISLPLYLGVHNTKEEWNMLLDKAIQEMLQSIGDEVYIQLGEREINPTVISLSYNKYSRRKQE